MYKKLYIIRTFKQQEKLLVYKIIIQFISKHSYALNYHHYINTACHFEQQAKKKTSPSDKLKHLTLDQSKVQTSD